MRRPAAGARRRRVLERTAPPTFDVVVEIQDRDRVTVHADVADTVDALLRGDPVAPELRWRDDAGVHRSQARPRPSPREQVGGERFAGLVGGGQGWRTEPGWRGDASYRSAPFEVERGARPGYRAGTSGGWRSPRSRTTSGGPRSSAGGRESSGTGGAGNGPDALGAYDDDRGRIGIIPGERFARSVSPSGAGVGGPVDGPFISGEIADRGPVERGIAQVAEPRARDARERERQREWRAAAARALATHDAGEESKPVDEFGRVRGRHP